jgi:hypothetical protein
MTTVKFQFDIDQELHTPGGPGCIEAMGLFWQPDGAQRIHYYVQLGRESAWFDEATLARLNPRQVKQLPMFARGSDIVLEAA